MWHDRKRGVKIASDLLGPFSRHKRGREGVHFWPRNRETRVRVSALSPSCSVTLGKPLPPPGPPSRPPRAPAPSPRPSAPKRRHGHRAATPARREPVPLAAMASRIGLRMQLMREQAQQEEQRERLQQQAVMHYMQQQQPQPQLGGPPTPAINTPVHFQSPPPVPGEVLKVGPVLRVGPVPSHPASGPPGTPAFCTPLRRCSPTWRTPPPTTCSSPGTRRCGSTCRRPTGTSLPPTSAPPRAPRSPCRLPPQGCGPDMCCPPQPAIVLPTAPWPCCTLAPTPRGR